MVYSADNLLLSQQQTTETGINIDEINTTKPLSINQSIFILYQATRAHSRPIRISWSLSLSVFDMSFCVYFCMFPVCPLCCFILISMDLESEINDDDDDKSTHNTVQYYHRQTRYQVVRQVEVSQSESMYNGNSTIIYFALNNVMIHD